MPSVMPSGAWQWAFVHYRTTGYQVAALVQEKGMNDKTKTVMLRNVPASTADLARQRVVKANLSDVDRMEPYVMAIWESAELQPFKIAMDDGSVVEGSPRADDQEIARLCRDAARASNDPVVSAWDLDHCRRAVGAVFRRFATSRIQVAAKRQA